MLPARDEPVVGLSQPQSVLICNATAMEPGRCRFDRLCGDEASFIRLARIAQ
jgi:hypothetical protein